MPPFSSLGMDNESKSLWIFFVGVPWALIVFSHPSCFKVKSVVSILISFTLHSATHEQCCCLAFKKKNPLMVPFLPYLKGGEVGHREIKIQLWKLFVGD